MAFQSWDWRGDGRSEAAVGEQSSGIMAFTSSESKRLIAKAVAAMPQVKAALESGRVIVAGGTTNAFVLEEILGKPIPKELYTKGNVSYGMMCTTKRSDLWVKPNVLVNGSPVDREATEVLKEFDARDVFIKGANAVDTDGNAGILIGGVAGGTIGGAIGTVTGQGAHLIMPVGLEKLVPSVIEAARKCGITRLTYPARATVGLFPVVNATVVTEIEAMSILVGVQATHVASGGIGGSEGSVVLVVEGPDERVRRAFELWESIKGEPAVPVPPIVLRYGPDGGSGRP